MTRSVLLIAAAVAAGAAGGCGSGQARPPAADPLPPIKGKVSPAATSGDAGPMKAPVPPRP
ncbi:hypothetical protein J0H58_30330 [bacterium]|nr:hypothetical protein [bacterium]